MFQVRDFLNVWTRESISLILREEYPSAHPNAHFNLLQGINNKLRLMFYNLFYPQSKVEGKLQLKGKWDIRDRVTRQKHPPPQTACWILESVLHVLVLCESLHLHHHFICWYTLHCLLLLKYAISILSVRFFKAKSSPLNWNLPSWVGEISGFYCLLFFKQFDGSSFPVCFLSSSVLPSSRVLPEDRLCAAFVWQNKETVPASHIDHCLAGMWCFH